MIFLCFSVFLYFCIVKPVTMKKNHLLLVVIAALMLASIRCEAQELVFKSISFNNVSNQKSEYFKYRDGVITYSNVNFEVALEFNNTGDSMLNVTKCFPIDCDFYLYYYKTGERWWKIKLEYTDAMWRDRSGDGHLTELFSSLSPHQSLSMVRYSRFYYHVFDEESPVHYISSIVPTMRLAIFLPGREPIFSDLPENIYVNGVKIDSDENGCDNCADLYRLMNNDLMQEYIRENSNVFGEVISDDKLREEFICNMNFARMLYPETMHP